MRAWHWTGLALCVAATAVVILQSNKLRETTIVPVSAAEPQPSQEAGVDSAAKPLKSPDHARELARLRNEVMQLRVQKVELEPARRENAELIAAKASGGTVAGRETPPGFVSKEKLANVGYATPEDAVQTFFWAMREGNFDQVIASFSPASKERQRIERMTPEDREKLRLKMQGGNRSELDSITDVGVRGKETISEDSLAVFVGSSLSTNAVRMQFDRTTEGWKVNMPGF